jgi:glycosyltransferase involved in cell wall biosynthesis
VFFVTGLDSGGIENYLLRFLKVKGSSFKHIFVFCKGGIGDQLEEDFKLIPNITILRKNIGFFNPISFFGLFYFFRINRINIVCDFTGNFSGIVLFMARLANVRRRVAFYRGSENHFEETQLKLLYNNLVKFLTYHFATSILSNSKAALDYFFGSSIQDKRFEVIYNGVEATNYEGKGSYIREEFLIPNDAYLVGHIGRFNKAKNHETIIKVAIEMCRKDRSIYFILCGNGVRENLFPVVVRERLNNQIILCENRRDVPAILNSLNCFYFPSLSEGQPNALIEAMIAGVPVVTSNIPSIREVFPNNMQNNLIDPLDSENAISRIYNFRTSSFHDECEHLKNWAKEKFNHETQFERFYKKLA